jgi:hypothetical protein
LTVSENLKREKNMTLNVGKEIAALQRLTVKELRARFAEAFGEDTNANNRDWLIKRIAWRVQALAEGGLSERARRRAAELACDADLRLSPPRVKAVPVEATGGTVTGVLADKVDARLPLPGTIITRAYKGETLQIKILPQGFEFEGEVYRSLSAVARAITGQHCNGFHFFRLGQEVAR